MGIISLNEKRTSDNPTHTTGKEKSYFTSDRFPEILEDPKIIGKYHYHGDGKCAFGAFWESTTGAISDLLFISTNPSFTANERTSQTHTDESTGWSSFEIDLADKPNGRPVFFVRLTEDSSGLYTFRSDVAFDDIELKTKNGSTISFDPSTSSIRSGGTWETTDDQDAGAANYTFVKSNYDPNDLSTIPNSNSTTNGKWNYATAGGGTSTNTGPDNAADNNNSTFYIYFESSSSNDYSATYLTWKDFHNLITGAAI